MKKSLLLVMLAVLAVFAFAACETVVKTTEQLIHEAYEAVKLDNEIVDGIELPNVGLNNATIAWISANPEIIGDDGVVVQVPVYDAEVCFNTTFSLGGINIEYHFDFVVKGRDKSLFDGNATEVFVEHDGSAIFMHDSFATLTGGGFTTFGGYQAFNNSITYGVEIYVDPANYVDGDYFVWSFGLNDCGDAYLAEAFMFFAMDNGALKVGTELPTDASIPVNDAASYAYATSQSGAVEITEAGWYTIICTFYVDANDDVYVEWNFLKDNDLVVLYNAVHQQVYDPDGSEIFEYLNAALVGSSRYAWLCRYSDGLQLDVRRVWMGI